MRFEHDRSLFDGRKRWQHKVQARRAETRGNSFIDSSDWRQWCTSAWMSKSANRHRIVHGRSEHGFPTLDADPSVPLPARPSAPPPLTHLGVDVVGLKGLLALVEQQAFKRCGLAALLLRLLHAEHGHAVLRGVAIPTIQGIVRISLPL